MISACRRSLFFVIPFLFMLTVHLLVSCHICTYACCILCTRLCLQLYLSIPLNLFGPPIPSELDEKTKSMLKLIEEDADSFAQRAEMYYKKRPELVNMVEDFYRAHRSLAERYDQLKLEAGTRLITTPTKSPFSVESPSQKPVNLPNKFLEASSDCFDSEESEVDDPEQEASQGDGEIEEEEEEISSKDSSASEVLKLREETDKDGSVSEVLKLREEVQRLKEQNRIQREELLERNEEKREAIRQLCLAMDMLKEENISLRKCLKDSKKGNPFEFSKWKGLFSGKLFSGFPKSHTTIVAL